MMRTLLLPTLLLPVLSQAQQLIVPPGTDDPMELHFNAAFMARNGVLSVEGTRQVKRDGEPIRDKNEHEEFRFDEQGRTTWKAIIFARNHAANDTSHVTYIHDARGLLTEQRRNDRSGQFAQRDSLDGEGRCLRRTHVRIQGPVTGGLSLPRPVETLISDERFIHTVINDTAWRVTWHNEHGLPYREQTHHKDRWGYLRMIEDRNIITGRRGSITFRYDEKGRLAERIEQADLASPHAVKHIWRYDNAGNVTLCDAWRNDEQTRHTEYLYEDGTLLLKAIIAKDMETGSIHITRYTTHRR